MVRRRTASTKTSGSRMAGVSLRAKPMPSTSAETVHIS